MKFLYYPIIYFISVLPLPVIYLISNFFGFVFSYLVPYRKKIIDKNLLIAFPEKSEKDRIKIRKAFYYSYSRMLLESFKLLTISSRKLYSLIEIKDNKSFQYLQKEKKGAIILTAHLGNFEWAGQLSGLILPYPVIAAYRVFKSKSWEKLIHRMRTRFNNIFIPASNMLRELVKRKNEGKYIVFLNDQLPQFSSEHCWLQFFGEETMFFNAPDKLAKSFDLPVYFMDMWRKKNGQYVVEVELIIDNPKKLEKDELIYRYAKKLEQCIKLHPESWLWSHNRWKRKKENDSSIKQ